MAAPLQVFIRALRDMLASGEAPRADEATTPAWLESHNLTVADMHDPAPWLDALDYLVREELDPRLAMLYSDYTRQSMNAIQAGGGQTVGGNTYNLGGGVGAITVPPLQLEHGGYETLDTILDVRNTFVDATTTNIVDDSDEITNVDNRVQQSIFAAGPVLQNFDNDLALAGDGGLAATAPITDSVISAGSGNAAGRDVIEEGAIVGSAITGQGTAQSSAGDAVNLQQTAGVAGSQTGLGLVPGSATAAAAAAASGDPLDGLGGSAAAAAASSDGLGESAAAAAAASSDGVALGTAAAGNDGIALGAAAAGSDGIALGTGAAAGGEPDGITIVDDFGTGAPLDDVAPAGSLTYENVSDQPIEYDGLMGDATIRQSSDASAYNATPIQAEAAVEQTNVVDVNVAVDDPARDEPPAD